MGIKRNAVVAALVSILTLPALAAEYNELSANGGEINWTKGQVVAEGYGSAPEGKNPKLAPMLACRAAMADAQRNLLETVKGARVSATSTVNNFVLESDIIKSSVDGVVKGARVVSRDPGSDGICKIVLSMPMGGAISSSIYEAEIKAGQLVQAWDVSNWLASLGNVEFSFFPEAHAANISEDWMQGIEKRLLSLEERLSGGSIPAAVAPTAPTGLVIDARGSNFIPSMSPRVRELRGGLVYPDGKAAEGAVRSGRLVSLFATDVDFALRHPRVGERPLLLKALRTWGDTRTEIVLGSESVAKMRELTDSQHFVDAGVIIVLD